MQTFFSWFGIMIDKFMSRFYPVQDITTLPYLPPEPQILPVQPPKPAPSLLTRFCLQIQAYEGYIPPCKQYPNGTPAWRNRNPGNLRDAATKIGMSPGGFAIFKDYATGFKALEDLVIYVARGKSKLYGQNPTIDSFFSVYAPTADGNLPKRYSLTVAKNLGVLPSTQLRTIII